MKVDVSKVRFSLITVPGIFQSQHNSRPLSREPLRHYRSYQPADRRDISGVIQHTRKRFQPFLHALFIDIHHAHAFEVAPLLAADLRATLGKRSLSADLSGPV